MKKRAIYKDGWHDAGDLEFYVENGKLLRGVIDGRTVYPYRACKTGGFDNISGVSAYYGVLKTVSWY